MSQPREHPLEALLEAVARAAPEPWYYQLHARQAGVEPDLLVDLLELLWLEGLIQKAPGSKETGPGVQLTPLGRQVLDDPQARERLRRGDPVTNEPGAIVRNSLRQPIQPVVTWLLLAANFAVFGYEVWLKRGNRGPFTTLLTGVSAADLIRGEWWRLLTCCFVHGGLLHLGMNMYALYAAGGFVERTWGHWRYFLIYMIAGWGGSCLAMAYSSPGTHLVGASGALCGILAAEGVWIFLNARHLPRAMARRGRSQFITTVVLIVFISLIPGVSGWAHLGGAVTGAAAGLILHYQRFGPTLVCWLGLLALLPLPWLSWAHLQDARGKNKGWFEAEKSVFKHDLRPTIADTMRASRMDYTDVEEVRDLHPERREPEQLAAGQKVIAAQLAALEVLTRKLEKIGPYHGPEVETARQKALDYARAQAELFREAGRCLEAGKEWKRADEKYLDQIKKKVRDSRKAWEDLLER
jgi:membrane associated rhomboid family serine protease